MADSFFSGSDAELYAGSANFSTKITATPTAFGLVAAQATAYAALNDTYAAAYLAAKDPETRTMGATAAKNAARAALKVMASDLAKIIDGTATVTDQQKLDLGLNVRATPAPVPPPALAPLLTVESVIGRVVRCKLSDAQAPTSKRRPPNAEGVTIMSFTGATPPPANDPGWKLEGQTGRLTFQVQFANDVQPGAKCWVTALWYNRRGQYSPAADPVQTYLQIGPVAEAA